MSLSPQPHPSLSQTNPLLVSQPSLHLLFVLAFPCVPSPRCSLFHFLCVFLVHLPFSQFDSTCIWGRIEPSAGRFDAWLERLSAKRHSFPPLPPTGSDIPIVVLSIVSPLGHYLPQNRSAFKPPTPPSPKNFGLSEEKLGPSLTGAILISHHDVHNCPIVSVAIGRPQPFHNLPTSFLSPCCLVRSSSPNPKCRR